MNLIISSPNRPTLIDDWIIWIWSILAAVVILLNLIRLLTIPSNCWIRRMSRPYLTDHFARRTMKRNDWFYNLIWIHHDSSPGEACGCELWPLRKDTIRICIINLLAFLKICRISTNWSLRWIIIRKGLSNPGLHDANATTCQTRIEWFCIFLIMDISNSCEAWVDFLHSSHKFLPATWQSAARIHMITLLSEP